MYEENNYRFLRHYSISDVDILYTEVIIFYPNHKFFFYFQLHVETTMMTAIQMKVN